jgi:hypothetical protein
MSDINKQIIKLLQSKIHVSHTDINSTPVDIIGIDEAADLILKTFVKSVLAREKTLLESIANGEEPSTSLDAVTTAFNDFCGESNNDQLLFNILDIYKSLKTGIIGIEDFISGLDSLIPVNPENDQPIIEIEPAEQQSEDDGEMPQYQQLVSANGYDTFSFAFKHEGNDINVPVDKVKSFVETDSFLSFCFNRLNEQDELEKIKIIYERYLKGVESYAKLILQ